MKIKNKCPLCANNRMKIIYYGLPANFCENDQCNCMWGFWTNITNMLPFNGALFVYSGNYFTALYDWMFNKS